MATITWIGGTSTSANTDANWQGGTKPAAGDVALFDNNAVANCVWDIPLPSTALSVDEIIVEDTYKDTTIPRTITLNAQVRIKGLFLNGTIVAGTQKIIHFESGFGSYKTYNNRYVLNGDDSISTGLEYQMKGTTVMFDDGNYPDVILVSGTFGPDYVAPTSTAVGKAVFATFNIQSTATSFAPLEALTPDDRKKTFSFLDSPGIAIAVFDMGQAVFELTSNSSGVRIPTTSHTLMTKYRKVVLKAQQAGQRVLVDDNTILSCDELEILDGVMLIGPKGNTAYGADIQTILPPKIRGTWSFYQISNGLYRSPKNAVGPMPIRHPLQFGGTAAVGSVGAGSVFLGKSGATDNLTLKNANGDVTFGPAASGFTTFDSGLDVTGTIRQSNATSAIVYADADGDLEELTVGSGLTLTGSTLAASGGGGSGTVTSVAVSGSDGIQVDSGSPITTSGTIALGVDKNTLLSHINVEDGADVTDTANVTAAGALMDSEVTNLAQVKAFDSADYATAAQNGTITSVATTAPITGGTITSTGTVGFDISGLTANTAIADADLLLLDDGANGTNRKITFTEVKEWIRGEGIKVGRDGGVNQLRIRDSRDDGELTPDDFLNQQVSFDFTDDLAGSTNTWDGVMTMKGWTDSYRVFQLYSSASSEGSSGKDTEPLYFRSGEDTGWGALRQVLTFPGTTPNADGSSGQVLQTDGSGVLSWATISGGGGSYTDADAISAIEGEADLELTGTVVISDVASADSVDALLELKSVENAQARMFISADTDVKLPVFHLRDIEANGGTRNHHYSAYLALDRASAIVTGSAQNDFLIVQGNYNKKMHFCTNNAGNGSQAQARMTIDKDGKVGVGTTSPAQNLDVAGTIRQDASTNAVLVSDGNGDIVSASNLADVAYLQAGAAGQDVFNPANPGNWQGGPPADIEQAIQRIAAQLVALGGPIP